MDKLASIAVPEAKGDHVARQSEDVEGAPVRHDIPAGHPPQHREVPATAAALLSARDRAYIHEAAKRGVFAYIVDADAEELQSAIDITLQRFTEYHNSPR